MKPKHHARGFVILDAVLGITTVVAMIMILAVAVSHHRRGLRQLADDRAAVRLAELTLVNLEARQPLPTVDAQTRLLLSPLSDPALQADRVWLQVRVEHHGRSAQVTGLVPRQSVSSLPAEVQP